MQTPSVDSIYLKGQSKRLFFLIHGYTGSTTDFNELPTYLHESTGADVEVMLLHGHGTRVEDLDTVTFAQLLEQVETELQKQITLYDEIIIGGVSFGAQLALILASRYPVTGVFHVCIPYRFKFPFNIPGIPLLRFFKKYWKKSVPPDEKRLRTHAFHYEHMHANGILIANQANKELRKGVSNITCPILAIHSSNDPIGNYRALDTLIYKSSTPYKKIVFNHNNHNVFFSESHTDIYDDIVRFFSHSE